ncbi:Phenylacetic acid catabolic protein [Notoacmeibacter ruber]|uniref:Phenylacetic acid catabolic n=1 Tax=Notoacmeibacter ruber TaxID=2670375 RepID=A0A3L7JDN5_9HYPH|nr:Phenylacetic acid catabolic protein [Notoacmeibacter ruber]RLQ88786.1 phenylacetic acid catabolic [Notoacmeibacter ruber]
MTGKAEIEHYLSQGGVLTAPDNVPARYRGELLRLMSSFVDSELAGSAGFADSINHAPGIKERIAASRIVLEKTDHAERVLDLMSDFGTDKTRYNQAHDWSARIERDATLAARRHGPDMRLSVFHFPLNGWVDAVVFNVLMGLATDVQLEEMNHISYRPLADVIRQIKPREKRHTELGLEGLERIVASPDGKSGAERSIAYWQPKVADTFGESGSDRFDRLNAIGLRSRPNAVLREQWSDLLNEKLQRLDLSRAAEISTVPHYGQE